MKALTDKYGNTFTFPEHENNYPKQYVDEHGNVIEERIDENSPTGKVYHSWTYSKMRELYPNEW